MIAVSSVILGSTLYGTIVAVRTLRESQALDASATSDTARKGPLSLSFAGDIMAHDVNYSRLPYDRIYERIAGLLTNDTLSFGNLEFPLDVSKEMTGYPRFNVHSSYVEAAVKAGFDVFSVANNHITDQGPESVAATFDELERLEESLGTKWSGLRRSAFDAIMPESIDVDGWHIGFIAITQFLNLGSGSQYVYLVDYKDPGIREDFVEFVRRCAEEYDLFVISCHGGTEYAVEPDPVKLAFFRELVRAGVDIVWAHHPHVLQPWYVEKVDGTEKLILASCGNFISGQTWHLEPDDVAHPRALTGDSAVFRVQVRWVEADTTTADTPGREDDGDATVVAVEPFLITNYRHPEWGMVVVPFDELGLVPMSPEWRRYYRLRLPEVAKIVYTK